MSGKINIELGSVQKTLLLPLWGALVETQKKERLLVDNTAVEIMDKINYDFSIIAGNINPITRYAWVARSLHFDRIIKHFLESHPKATIVNIGCGLDTTFDRIDNGSLIWYDLDLPDVIKLRREFIRENERRRFIACSFLDKAWFQQVKIEDNILFFAAGVLYYFEENQIKSFLIRLADLFPGSEIVFDSASPRGVEASNKMVLKAGGMDESSVLKWGIKSAKIVHSWDTRIKVVDEYPLFKNMKKNLVLGMKLGTFISDVLKIMSIVHLKFLK